MSQISDLPVQINEDLPLGAKNIFTAAFTSAQRDGMDEQAALNVAWSSVRQDYEKGADGTWHHKPDDTNIHNKSVQSGGN